MELRRVLTINDPFRADETDKERDEDDRGFHFWVVALGKRMNPVPEIGPLSIISVDK